MLELTTVGSRTASSERTTAGLRQTISYCPLKSDTVILLEVAAVVIVLPVSYIHVYHIIRSQLPIPLAQTTTCSVGGVYGVWSGVVCYIRQVVAQRALVEVVTNGCDQPAGRAAVQTSFESLYAPLLLVNNARGRAPLALYTHINTFILFRA